MPSESELVATERLRNLTKLTGDIEVDALKNLQLMLYDKMKTDDKFKTKAIEIYDVNPDIIPRFPAVCLELTGSNNRRRTMGHDFATFQRDVFIDVWYYHADVSEKFNSSEVIVNMSRIISIIQRNGNINGYCRMGVRLEGETSIIDKIFSSKIVRGAKISLMIPILYRDRSADLGP